MTQNQLDNCPYCNLPTVVQSHSGHLRCRSCLARFFPGGLKPVEPRVSDDQASPTMPRIPLEPLTPKVDDVEDFNYRKIRIPKYQNPEVRKRVFFLRSQGFSKYRIMQTVKLSDDTVNRILATEGQY